MALVALFAPHEARGQLLTPPGWFSGDVHVHQPDDCLGVADASTVVNAMPADLHVASVLIWCPEGRLPIDAAMNFLGQQDDPVSTVERIVHYDLEVSRCGDADRLGHGVYLNLADINFPASTYQGPIQEWALAQPGAIVGVDHATSFASGYDEFPPLRGCCTPYEAPMSVALGRADFIGYQPPLEPGSWRFLWYTLLDVGFRPGLAANSDAYCLDLPIGSARTYARIEGELTYQKFVGAIAGGRVVVVEGQDNFIEFTVDGVGTGDQVSLPQPGGPIELRARLIAPEGVAISGTLEIIRNQEVIAATSYSELTGEYELVTSDRVGRSSWYAARTDRSHSGAIFVIVAGRPIRASVASALYYVDYMQWLGTLVASGHFAEMGSIDETPLLADIAAAQTVFDDILIETVPDAPRALQQGVAAAVLLSLWGRGTRRLRGAPAIPQRRHTR